MTHQISIRATRCGQLAFFDLSKPATISHSLAIPAEMCPRTGNPVSGTIEITYTASRAIEVVALHRLINARPSSSTFEGWVREIGDHCASVVGAVNVEARAEVAPGPQSLKVSLCCSI